MTDFIAATTAAAGGIFGVGSFALSKPSGVQAGDLVLITAVDTQAGTSPSTPTGFTLLDSLTSPGTEWKQFTWGRILDGSEGSSFTVNYSGNTFMAGICAAYRGASELHVHNGQVGLVNSSSNQVPATAPSVDANAKELLVVIWGWRTDYSPGGQAVPAGMTKRAASGQTGMAVCLADILELSSGGATGSKLATTPSSENNEYSGGQQLAFTVAGGGLSMLV